MYVRPLMLLCLVLCGCSKSEASERNVLREISNEKIHQADAHSMVVYSGVLLGELIRVLEGIDDAESAAAAGPLLESLAMHAGPLTLRRKQLLGPRGTHADRMAFAQASMDTIGELDRLKREIERFRAIAGVQPAVAEAVAKIAGHFDLT